MRKLKSVTAIPTGTYRITKPHVRFYFLFIFPHLTILEKEGPKSFYEEVIEEAFPGFIREIYRKN